MKILYGVQATGNGHISRSREVIAELKKRGHEVSVILSGRDPAQLWDMEVFKPFTAFKGLSFIIKDGKIDKLKTAINLDIPCLYMDSSEYDPRGAELVIIDFEPVAARIARKHKLPLIGIGHQYAFNYNILMDGRRIIDKFIMKYFAPAQYNVGLHWHHFNQPLLPPIIPALKRDNSRIIKNKIIVYLPFEDKNVIKTFLNSFTGYEFFVYYSVKEPEDYDNVHFRPFGRQAFLDDLFESNGVICNAGFELPSEGIHLGKKLLIKPVHGQFEQMSNVLAIKELKLGMAMDNLCKKTTVEWLDNFSSDGIIFASVPPALADWIEMRNWNDITSLSKELWSKTIFCNE